MSVTPDTTLTGTLFDTSGTAMAGTVVLTLSNIGIWPAVVTGTGLFAALSITAQADGSGNFSIDFFSNGVISPSGTFYTLTVYAPGSNVAVWEASYLIAAGGSYDLSSLVPLVPNNSGGTGGWGFLGTGEPGGSSGETNLLKNYFKIPGFYDVSAFCPGQFTSTQLMFMVPVDRTVSIPANATGSVAVCGTAPTADAVFTFNKNGTSFGTLTIGAGTTTGTFATTATTFASGDVLSVVAQALTDSTFANLAFTLAGTV
jgi:hypothetical protein